MFSLGVDVTKVSNKLGSECVTINGEYRKKNITGLTIICDQNKLPLSVSSVNINRKLNNNLKTATHEIKNVQKSLLHKIINKIIINIYNDV